MGGKKGAKANRRRGGKRSKTLYHKPGIGSSPVPNHYVTQMAYFTTVPIQEAAAGAGGYYTFSLNNCFDPDFSGSGAQPVSFDQWSQMYSRYRVIKTDVVAHWVGGTAVPGDVCYFLSPTGTMPGNPNAWPSQRMGDFDIIGNWTGGKPNVTKKFSVLPWEGLSLTKAQYMDDMDYSHSSTSGPSRPLYCTFTVRGYGSILAVTLAIRLVYHVELSEPVNMNIS